MNEDWKPAPPSDTRLELPPFAQSPDRQAEKHDTLNTSVPSANPDQTSPAPDPGAARQKRLEQLRERPAFKLIANSHLLLKACQLDMDYPPRLRDYLRTELKTLLLAKTGKPLSPDKLHIAFSTFTSPDVDDAGRERYLRRLSLTELGVLSFNFPLLHAVQQSTYANRPLDPAAPTLTARTALQLIAAGHWTRSYPALLEKFWTHHRTTWRALARLGFLDELSRRYAKAEITHDGYQLALDALGLDAFPTTAQELEQTLRGTRTTVSMLSINGYRIPDLFQLQSNNTSHCFIHLPGSSAAPVEYISDNPERMTQKLLDALNASGDLNTWVETALGQSQAPASIRLEIIEGDLFGAMAHAQERLGLAYLNTQVGISAQADPFKAIGRAMKLISAVDIWQARPAIIEQLPNPLKTAAELMRIILRDALGVEANPDHVFLRYLRGHSITSLGNARQPGIVVQVPDERPVSLSQALVNNYRVEQPQGYIDHGARHAVYLDISGKGLWSASEELPIDVRTLEAQIRNIDFLPLMTERIDKFWEQHSTAIDQTLQAHFMCQAIACLKQGSLRRSGFDLLVMAIEQLKVAPAARTVEWSVPGFFVQHSVLEGPREQYCPSLWVLSVAGRPQRVLYQAGMLRALAEFDSEALLDRYLLQATRSETWRQSVLAYVPVRQHERLAYILKVWGGEQLPDRPVSVLRPWTDVLANQDTRIAQSHDRSHRRIADSPIAWTREMLRQNCRLNAEDQIVTSREVSLNYWTRQLSHLQLLLAPMSLLLTPALIAALAAEIAALSLAVAAVNLPGERHAEKKQLLITSLSMGLLQLPPFTPRLASALGKLGALARTSPRAAVTLTATSKNFQWLLSGSLIPRRTRLEKFFHTDSRLKTWLIPAHPRFGGAPIKVWKLQRRFLIWTTDRSQARTLVVSSHGYYLPWTRNAHIPNGTELQVFAPHGHELLDPKLHKVVSRRLGAYARLNRLENLSGGGRSGPYVLNEKLMAGTVRPGMIKNYSLSKFQSGTHESYEYIIQTVRNANRSPLLGQLPNTPMDVLTIRNRFGMAQPNLEELFNALFENGIHYDRIILLHCRCSAFKSVLGLAPVYPAP